jgi:uncharacterized protein (DUF1697 family)
MPGYIALIRAVNVGGQGALPMADLRSKLRDNGFGEARTLLQTGNLVLRTNDRTPRALEGRLEAFLDQQFRFPTSVFVRTPSEWSAIIAANPFPKEAAAAPARLALFCLKETPSTSAILNARDAAHGREVLAVKGREAYVVYPDGMGTSRLTSAVVEKKLQTAGTARNWNTVGKLAVLAES